MKFLLVLAAVGLSMAEPEADPAFAYTVGGLHAPLVYTAGVHHGYPYGLGYGYPYAVAAAGCRNDAGALVPCAQGVLPYVTHGVLPAAPAAAEEPAVEEARKKREAEAEADPAVLYSTTVVKNPVPALTYYAPYAHHLGAYSHYGAYGLGGYGLWGRKKREAEAEPEAEADPYLAYGYGYPLTYSHAAYHPYALHAGCRNYLGALVPCGRKKREAEAEAEAEADPWLAYGYGYPYAYSHAAYHPYAYHALGGCRNYLGGLVPCAGR